MYGQQQPQRMAGNGPQQQFQQATSVNAQFPPGYNNTTQVSNYPQNQQQWNNGGSYGQNFPGYNEFQNWPQPPGGAAAANWNPGWPNNNQEIQKQNSGQQPPSCDNYQRTFDYVQQCQNWTNAQ